MNACKVMHLSIYLNHEISSMDTLFAFGEPANYHDVSNACCRLFFEACGFKEDVLGSTTMMYTQAAGSLVEDDLLVKRAGRMLLLLPPMREPTFSSKMTPVDEKGV